MTPYLSATLELAQRLGRTPTQTELRSIGVPKSKLSYVIYYLGLPPRKQGLRTDGVECEPLKVLEPWVSGKTLETEGLTKSLRKLKDYRYRKPVESDIAWQDDRWMA